MAFNRRHPLDPKRFQYLEGCVREEAPYEVPRFDAHDDKPLLYVSFGSLGAGDTDLMKRLMPPWARCPTACWSTSATMASLRASPGNCTSRAGIPQPSVIPQVDAVIHHGGNNSFTECLYFGKPAIIMPYVWDGHDNATRVQETGYGLKLDRYAWSDGDLARASRAC